MDRIWSVLGQEESRRQKTGMTRKVIEDDADSKHDRKTDTVVGVSVISSNDASEEERQHANLQVQFVPVRVWIL
jgi:hypothetical protein